MEGRRLHELAQPAAAARADGEARRDDELPRLRQVVAAGHQQDARAGGGEELDDAAGVGVEALEVLHDDDEALRGDDALDDLRVVARAEDDVAERSQR